MKKKKLSTHEKNQLSTVKSEPNALFQDIRKLIDETRSSVAVTVNAGLLQCFTGKSESVFIRKYYKKIVRNMERRLSRHWGDN